MPKMNCLKTDCFNITDVSDMDAYPLSTKLGANMSPRAFNQTKETHCAIIVTLRPGSLQLLLIQVTQLVDLCRLTRQNALGDLDRATDRSPAGDGILRRLGSHLDDDDSRVVRSTVVLAVAEVAHPRLQCRAVVLVHFLPVRLNRRGARDGRPLAGAVQEAQVHGLVGGQVVRLTRFRVGVEDVVDAVALLEKDARGQGLVIPSL